jgi:NAD(P)-dependent dehydrogenase (short-subunit alcohol dehydrogenase family)
MNFDGLRVAITGGGRGTGRLLAEAFAERGAQIFLSARDLAAAEHLRRRSASGGQVGLMHFAATSP